MEKKSRRDLDLDQTKPNVELVRAIFRQTQTHTHRHTDGDEYSIVDNLSGRGLYISFGTLQEDKF